VEPAPNPERHRASPHTPDAESPAKRHAQTENDQRQHAHERSGLSLPRWAAGIAVAFFTLSPLGLAWQRLTLLDNIGTPLLIGAWVLALSPRRRLAAYLGSGLALGAAVLVKQTNALFVPFIATQLWLTNTPQQRPLCPDTIRR
jgi:hypothetical protein